MSAHDVPFCEFPTHWRDSEVMKQAVKAGLDQLVALRAGKYRIGTMELVRRLRPFHRITRFDRLLAAPTAAHKGLPGTEAPQHPRQEETAIQEAPKGLSKASPVVDIIIPLGPGSKAGNAELRILLRSLEKHGRGIGRILLVTDCAPAWLVPGNGLEVVPCKDTYAHNKDANLFLKLIAGMNLATTPDIVWTCDDCALLQPLDFATLPPIYSTRPYRDFKKEGKWHKRMRMTMKELRLFNWHFDTHTPQRWNVEAARAAIATIPYTLSRGRCINTATMGRIHGTKEVPAGAWKQGDVKETCEKEETGKAATLDKLFVAYNDAGFIEGGLWGRLVEAFPSPSRWEAR